ncbi:flavin reductase family protein [Clostridium algidicarnis]|uniref:flavin reductase family protein n=1 Tax=Clostridium algidicarnis TaxID=37659 RepID=UPI001C0CA507|nr:flavin reductase family protein [Clostridium algidicarnis]MBU3193531.1 flavin reductase family protein [Clostridium algidicarnis]
MEGLKSNDKAMKSFHKHGGFLTCKNEEILNTMTISWGNIGVAFGKPIFIIYVRKSRFTNELINKSGEFTISIPLDSNLKKQLGIFGSTSGRDIDKFKLTGVKSKDSNKLNTPIIEGCDAYFECKVIYKHDINPEIMDDEISKNTYLEGDYHTVFYGEIVDYYIGED